LDDQLDSDSKSEGHGRHSETSKSEGHGREEVLHTILYSWTRGLQCMLHHFLGLLVLLKRKSFTFTNLVEQCAEEIF